MSKSRTTSILNQLHHDFPLISREDSVSDVYEKFRKIHLKHKIIYLYVVDESKRLLGVLPIRRLLTAQPDTKIRDLFLPDCFSLTATTTEEEARDAFIKHKFLAFPVIDEEKRILGVLDIERFAGDLGDITAKSNVDEIYEIFGLTLSDKIQKSPIKSTLFRLPWLFATMACGLMAAGLTGLFETTLSASIYITFFVTLVLGLNESIAMQSATLAVHRLRSQKATLNDFLSALQREVLSAVVLGLVLGVLVGVVVSFWKESSSMGLVLALSLTLTTILSCLWGILIPYFLHSLKKDPKVAIGPLVLGCTDLSTLSLYFFIAKTVLATAA